MKTSKVAVLLSLSIIITSCFWIMLQLGPHYQPQGHNPSKSSHKTTVDQAVERGGDARTKGHNPSKSSHKTTVDQAVGRGGGARTKGHNPSKSSHKTIVDQTVGRGGGARTKGHNPSKRSHKTTVDQAVGRGGGARTKGHNPSKGSHKTTVDQAVGRGGDARTKGQGVRRDLGGAETFDTGPGFYSLPLDLMKCDNCFRWRYPLRLQPRRDLCKANGGGSQVIDLLILCNTKHTNTQHRKVLRDIYNPGNIKGRNVRLIFLFGNDPGGDKQLEADLVQESATHGDILQTVVNGTYHNLTLLVFNGYQWALDHCPGARFTAKVSDDHLMNLVGVLDLLDQFGDTQLHDVVFGWCSMRLFPFRTPRTHKMYMNYEMYPFALLPRFCAGACLLISIATVRDILKEAGNMAYPTILDDGNIGMIIQFTGHQTCHIPHVEIRRLEQLKKLFTSNSPRKGVPEICAAVRSAGPTLGIHLHGFRPDLMKVLWKNCENFQQHLVKGAIPVSCPRRKLPYVKTPGIQGHRWIQNQNL